MQQRRPFLILLLAFATPSFAAAATCDASNQPRVLLTGVSGPGCLADPLAQCLSDFSLELVDAACSMKPNLVSLPKASATVRLQKRWDAGGRVKRNAMTATYPFIGDEAYTLCSTRVGNMSAVAGATINAILAALFNSVDTDSVTSHWAVTNTSASRFTATHAATGCALSYAVLSDGMDAYVPLTAGAAEGSLTLADGQYEVLLSEDAPTPQFVAALCPAGTYSYRPATGDITSRTECDPMPAGYATNGVGAPLGPSNATLCRAGTYARPGAAMCLPCDSDMYAPFDGMPVCAECVDGYAPVQGSTRCFAGFSGRVLVTEGQSSGAAGKVYDPNNALAKIYGDVGGDVAISAVWPAGYTTYVNGDNTDDQVPQLGDPLSGWAVIRFDASPSVTGASIDFMQRCVAGTTLTAAVEVSDTALATLSVLSSQACGQMNGVVEDLSGTVPAEFTTPTGNWQNLTLRYASPTELVAFGHNATSGTVILHVSAAGGSVTFVALADSTSATAVTAQYERGVTVVTNTFGQYVQPVESLCAPGTYFSQVANAAGVTYSRQCLPCPTGSYCPSRGPGLSPVATPCPAGTRGTVFGATNASLCVPCKARWYQGTPGSMTCDVCNVATAQQGATTCPQFCEDGTEGDPTGDAGCTPCPAGTYRFGSDMPRCVACPAGNEIRKANATTGQDYAINGLLDEGGEVCSPCTPGYANDFVTTGQCTACAAGAYSPRGGQRTCLPCALGTWQNATASTECKKAVRGTYVDVLGATVNNVTCPPGYSGLVAGAVSLRTGCGKCQPGSFSPVAGAISCTSCLIGSFQDKSAQTRCNKCPAGTTNSIARSASCAICAPGSYSSASSIACAKCAIGTYQDRAKSSGCKPCPAGTFCPQVGMVAPLKCPSGTYNPRPNGSAQRLACLPCAKSRTPGASKC